jgi:hypothetical protein
MHPEAAALLQQRRENRLQPHHKPFPPLLGVAVGLFLGRGAKGFILLYRFAGLRTFGLPTGG